ncbi:MAG: Crp/Fnr family transcriptional regulator [Bacteriovorax sp.]|nr:Crp/Fnr family transcriptional regulator [Bacteriovorax sp.]
MPDISEKKSVHCHSCPAWKQSTFHTLSEIQLNDLQVNKTSFEYHRGAHLNQKGNPANGAYCIGSGQAKIIWPEVDGKESIVKIVSPGDMTGYRCLFSEDTFRATAVALGSIRGCFIPKEHFNGLLKDDHQFNFEILKRMGNELKLAEKRLHSFCQKNVRERLAEALLILKESCGVQQDDRWVLDIQLTREEISAWIGSAKETVVRSLSDMKDEKVIEQEGLHIVLLNIQALRQIAGLTE